MAGPLEGFTISAASMETITPIPYDILKVVLLPSLWAVLDVKVPRKPVILGGADMISDLSAVFCRLSRCSQYHSQSVTV